MQFETIKSNYDRKLWNKEMVKMAVYKKVISEEQYKQITGALYVNTISGNIREQKIALSKELLEQFLLENPLLWTDGKYYNVTKEKQSLLTSALTIYNIKIESGQTATLKWNSIGEEYTEWTLENLNALAVAIANYVEPLVAQQQAYEIAIRNAVTDADVNNIKIQYRIA